MSVPISGDPTISGVVLTEQSATPASPASGKRKVFVDTAGTLKLVNSAGTVSAAAGGTLDAVGDVNAPAPTDGQVLTWDATPGEWVAATPSGLTNPMTTAEDVIKGGASGAPTRVAVGSNGQVLTVTAGAVGWAAATTGSHAIESGSHTTAGGTDGYALRQTGATSFAWEADYAALAFTLGDGTNAIVAASEPDQWVRLPFAGVIVRASLGADAAGSIVCDVWVDTHANYPPTVADSICASAKPTLSSAASGQDTTLAGWSTTLAEGSWIRVHVDSSSVVKRAVLELRIRKT